MNKLELLVQTHIQEVGFGRVGNINECYYILPDGTFLGCNYDCGSRGDDHRAIFSSCDIEYGDWDALHSQYNLIRYIPECDEGIIKIGQELTPEQKEVVKMYDLEIEEY